MHTSDIKDIVHVEPFREHEVFTGNQETPQCGFKNVKSNTIPQKHKIIFCVLRKIHYSLTLAGRIRKEQMPKIRNKYSQKRNCSSSVPIFTVMCMWAISIFPWSICLFFCWKYVDWPWEYINRSQTHKCRKIGNEAVQFSKKDYINGIFVAVYLLCTAERQLLGPAAQLCWAHAAGPARPRPWPVRRVGWAAAGPPGSCAGWGWRKLLRRRRGWRPAAGREGRLLLVRRCCLCRRRRAPDSWIDTPAQKNQLYKSSKLQFSKGSCD